MKTLTIISVALILAGLCAYCKADAYMTAGFGQSEWSAGNSRLYLFPDLAACVGCTYTMTLKEDNESTAVSVFYGLTLNRYIALEAGYMDTGKSSVSFNLDGNYTNCLSTGLDCSGTFNESMSFRVSGPVVRLAISYPIGKFSIFYKPGLYRASLKTSDSESVYDLDIGSGVASRESKFTKTLSLNTYGLAYQVNKSWSLTIESSEFDLGFSAGQGLNHTEYFVDNEVKIKTLSMGIGYKF